MHSESEQRLEQRTINSASLGDARLCVITPYYPTVSETFIRGHVERLPAKTVLIHGWPPAVGDAPVLSWPVRVGYKLHKRLARNGSTGETTAAYVTAFRRFRPDVVLAEYGPTGVDVMEACRRANLPLVVHFHGYDASRREVLETYAEAYVELFRQAAGIVAVSREMQRRLISLGAPAEKVHYNPCGVDCREFVGADPKNSSPTLLAVGRFVEKKGPKLTLQAFGRALSQAADARLRMIGDGPLLDECRQLIAELQIGHAVELLGAQPPSVVQHEMRHARAFVQHSIEASDGDCEGTPVGILEASASGLPVIATRHGGIPDVVIDGETGLLSDERDVSRMSENILRLLRDPQLASVLGTAARARIEAHFSQTQSDQRLWSIINASRVGRNGHRIADDDVDLMKRLKRAALKSAKIAGISRLVRNSRWRRQRLLILAYHGISSLDEHEWNYTQYMPPEVLRSRFQQLRDLRCAVLPLDEAVARLRTGDLPERAVAITFDDGFADFHSQAFPLIREFDLPATLYLTTFYSQFNRPVFDLMVAYLLWKGRNATLDLEPLIGAAGRFNLREAATRNAARLAILGFAQQQEFSAEQKDTLVSELARALRVDYETLLEKRILQNLTPVEVRELAANGIDVQLHTHRHRTPQDRGLFMREIEDNRTSIRSMTGKQATHFCYPSGVYHPMFFPWMSEAGIVSATTCEPGIASADSHLLLLPRIVDSPALGPIEFESWLTGVSAALPRRATAHGVHG